MNARTASAHEGWTERTHVDVPRGVATDAPEALDLIDRIEFGDPTGVQVPACSPAE
jgi:hypothetical protein